MRFSSTKPMKPWQGILFGLIFLFAGIEVLLLSVSTIKSYNEKNETYKEVTSVVVDYDYNDDDLEAIIVEYVVDGQTYRKKSNTYSSVHKMKGTEVKLKYDPNNPSEAIWVNDSTNIVMPLFGGAFSLAGVFIIINSFKMMKKEKNSTVVQPGTVENWQNNQSLEQQMGGSQINPNGNFQTQQNVDQPQQTVNNQVQNPYIENTGVMNGQDKNNNQNNMNNL